MSNNNVSCRECDDQEGPVTVTVRRRVIPGRETEYEEWLRATAEGASHFPGMMGVNFIRPDGIQQKDYVSIFRFDTYRHLWEWEDSAQRTDGLQRVEELFEGGAQVRKATGLEFWFTLPDVPMNKAPSQHKMALVLIVVVFVLVVSINLGFGTLLMDFPILVRIAMVVVVQVLLMTYIIMPQVTRLLKPWLFGSDSTG